MHTQSRPWKYRIDRFLSVHVPASLGLNEQSTRPAAGSSYAAALGKHEFFQSFVGAAAPRERTSLPASSTVTSFRRLFPPVRVGTSDTTKVLSDPSCAANCRRGCRRDARARSPSSRLFRAADDATSRARRLAPRE